MGPDPTNGAVVDRKLRVHGISGLRVADASIMPRVVGGNTNAPSIMIGEKAFDLINEFWKISSRSNSAEARILDQSKSLDDEKEPVLASKNGPKVDTTTPQPLAQESELRELKRASYCHNRNQVLCPHQEN